MKKMFVVMEVKEFPNSERWVMPIDGSMNPMDREQILRGRIFYSNEMEDVTYENKMIREIKFLGFSPTPEPELSAREKWIEECPIGKNWPEGHPANIKDWIRREPKE